MKILTKELENKFAKVGSTAELEAHEIKIIMHLFQGPFDWWLYERDDEQPDIFWAFVCLGDSQCAECGTVSLSEIESLRIPPFGLPIERDLYWNQDTTLKDIQKKIKPWMYDEDDKNQFITLNFRQMEITIKNNPMFADHLAAKLFERHHVEVILHLTGFPWPKQKIINVRPAGAQTMKNVVVHMLRLDATAKPDRSGFRGVATRFMETADIRLS